jgi:ABC-type nitrate/sulfonate/bicarbonate transport system permease component
MNLTTPINTLVFNPDSQVCREASVRTYAACSMQRRNSSMSTTTISAYADSCDRLASQARVPPARPLAVAHRLCKLAHQGASCARLPARVSAHLCASCVRFVRAFLLACAFLLAYAFGCARACLHLIAWLGFRQPACLRCCVHCCARV